MKRYREYFLVRRFCPDVLLFCFAPLSLSAAYIALKYHSPAPPLPSSTRSASLRIAAPGLRRRGNPTDIPSYRVIPALPPPRFIPPPQMLPYETIAAAEAALGRNLTAAESLWFRYSAWMPDYLVYYHNIVFLFIVFTLVPLPLAFLELRFPSALSRYKLQPKVQLPPTSFFQCYKDVMRVFILVVGPLQLLSYPSVKFVGIRTGLPLPSVGEMAAQLLVYFLVEDYGNYWIHRLMHGRWGYEKIHRVHHEYTAPIGFAAPYAHWAEVLLLGIPSFVGPAIAPGHMITFWLWIILRQVEAIETHSGYDFPLSPTKYIPFYGGAEYHDYHHYVGGQSHSNFASVFTYCDYIYGTDRGYRYHKAQLAKLREQRGIGGQNGEANGWNKNKSE